MKGVRNFAVLGLVLLALVLYSFWFGESGHFAARRLAQQVAEEEKRTAALAERNRALAVEVAALKEGLDAVEARARTDLGMVAPGETFYLVMDGARR